jgi:hypothetical protein
MAERPYTDDDLRAEAARQHAGLTEDPDFMGVGEAMEDSEVESLAPRHEPQDIDGQPNDADGVTWNQLLPFEADEGAAYRTAQHAIYDLINGAADVSEWAVNLGADDLEPLPEQLTAHTQDGPWFRLHFAVRPDMPDDMRRALVEGVGSEIAKHFPTA